MLIHIMEKKKHLFSSNSKDFGTTEVRESLDNTGIRYFRMAQHFLDWFNSRSST